MMMITAALILLCFSTAAAATIWTIIGWSYWEYNPWRAFWNFNLAFANLIGAIIIGSRLLEHPIDLPRGVSTLLLLPLIAIPPALRLRDWYAARALTKQRERIHE